MCSLDKNKEFWDNTRSNYNLIPGLTYLDNATYSPSPVKVVESIERWYSHIAANPAFPMRFTELDGIRDIIADYVQVTPEEIAITRSSTDGLQLILQGIKWRQGDEIFSFFDEHSDTGIALEILRQRYGIIINRPDIDWIDHSDKELINQLDYQFTDRTRLLIIPHIDAASGRLLPVAAINNSARKKGVLSLLDASQSFGAGAINFYNLDADYIIASGHTRLAAGLGTGISYFRKDSQSHIWQTAGSFYDPNLLPISEDSAIRFERNGGQKNIPCLLSIAEAISYQKKIGLDKIARRISSLTSLLHESLRGIDWLSVIAHNGIGSDNLIVIDVYNYAASELHDTLLRKHNIKVGLIKHLDKEYINISPHVNNSEEDIYRFVNAVKFEMTI